jgi:glutamate decarboxylase
MLSKKAHATEQSQQKEMVSYLHRDYDKQVPKFEMHEEGMPSDVATHIIERELTLDGNPTLNLASFVTTWMEPKAKKLMQETIDKNYVDYDEYPQTVEIQNRCVNMLAHLFNSPHGEAAIGTATVGSSEAIHLCGLSLKWNWAKRRKAQGKPTDKPNIIMGANVQVCWDKFARYFEVEPRFVNLTKDRYIIGVEEALELVDENTIAVVGILGSTLTGEFEPIKKLNDALVEMNKKTGWDVPIHVDAASGGFVAPFLYPDLEWDFRLPLVKSINVSGHKYGLVYPGVGWAVWRDEHELPEELIFHVNYLGSDEASFNLNFSKGSSQIIAQYYNFLRLGRSGYTKVMRSLKELSDYICDRVEENGRFILLSNRESLPVICVKLKDNANFTVFDISHKLRESGWIVPAYTLAPDAQEIAVLRIVVRDGFNRDLADILMDSIDKCCKQLDEQGGIHKHDLAKKHGVC